MQQITTFLMFEGRAEEATIFYISLFRNSEILSVSRYTAGDAGAEGTVKYAVFSLNGQQFICIDSSLKHGFTFTPAMSFYVNCESEEQITHLFRKLSENGQILMPLDTYPFSKKYGWIADRFGVSWQLNFEQTV